MQVVIVGGMLLLSQGALVALQSHFPALFLDRVSLSIIMEPSAVVVVAVEAAQATHRAIIIFMPVVVAVVGLVQIQQPVRELL